MTTIEKTKIKSAGISSSRHKTSGNKIVLPFSDAQLDLLEAYPNNVSDEDIEAIRGIFARYSWKKITDEFDKIWEENNLTDETAEEFFDRHKLYKNRNAK